MQKSDSAAEALAPCGLLILGEEQEAVEEKCMGYGDRQVGFKASSFIYVTLNELDNLSEPPLFPQKSVCVLTTLPHRAVWQNK